MTKSWKETYSGGYLKAADLPATGKKMRIMDVIKKIIRVGEEPKLVASLKGEKAWVLNATNCELLEVIFDSEDPDDWRGLVDLFNDRTVRGPNGEKGGVRVRPATSRPKALRQSKVKSEPNYDEDLGDMDDVEKLDVDDDLADLDDDE